MQTTTVPRIANRGHKKVSVQSKKRDEQKYFEQNYTKYFVPVQSTPENFKIFTLTDWETPVSTGGHT